MTQQLTAPRLAILVTVLAISISYASASDPDPFRIAGFDCGRVQELGIDKQLNLRASAILRYCSGGGTDLPQPQGTLVEAAYEPLGLSLLGGTDINLITGTETHPKVTQAESAAWGHGNTIVVAYDDSRGSGGTPASYCGVSVSTDGGATFTRSSYLFNTTGACFGDPTVFYSVRAAKWFIGFFAGRCNTGFGQWESTDGVNWSESGCIVNANGPDFLSSWVDNNPASPYYGRQYALFNNFAVGSGAVQLAYSTDDGVNWSAPVTVFAAFRRANKVVGSLGSDGTIFVQTTDEGGGGLSTLRANWIHRSVDGGVTWTTPISQGSSYMPPGRSGTGFVPGMYSTPVAGYWRVLPAGQPGVGPGGVVHYVYTARPTPTGDPGNIFYVRSNDNGSTWPVQIQMNTDTGVRGQWQPALAVNSRGKVMVTWFDERNFTTDSLQRFGRVSLDNGLTWGPDMPVSDVGFPKPLQPDPGVVPTYAGDRHEAAFSNDNFGSTAYDTWTDGRIAVMSTTQQDVFFDKFNLGSTPFDFDGDAKSDIGIYRPAAGEWWIQRSSNGSTFVAPFGSPGIKIVPADYTGDGKSDLAFWVPSTGNWFVLRSEDFSYYAFPFGVSGDIPVTFEFDSDGKADPTVFRPSNSTWYINRSTGGAAFQTFGASGDVPVPGDYDGDGRSDLAIYRPSNGQWWINRSAAGLLVATFGGAGDKQVQGDYTGDGKTDVAIWRPATGTWFVLRSEDLSFYAFPFGISTDVPAPADYDGDGKYDATVFRPSSATWFVLRSTGGTLTQPFGASTDLPIANAFVP